MNDTTRLLWLMSRLDGLALDQITESPLVGHIKSPVTRETLDAAIERSTSADIDAATGTADDYIPAAVAAAVAAVLPLKTIVASLEGIKVEIYATKAYRYIMRFNKSDPDEWEQVAATRLDEYGLSLLVKGMNADDARKVGIAIQEVLHAQ
jgi:hypothetical protein